MPYSFVAVGVRELHLGGGPSASGQEGFAFLIPGSTAGGMKIVGELVEDFGHYLVVRDDRQKHRNGRPFRWIFTKLTRWSFSMMSNDIDGYGELERRLRTDEQIQAFYRTNFLHKYWVTQYEQRGDVG